MKKKCGNCQKKRMLKFFETPRTRYCDMCKISLRYQRKKAKRKQTKSYYIKKLDKLVGDKVRARGECEGDRRHKGPLQWAHIVSRRYHNTRWLEENALCLCSGCHKYYTDRPLEWDEFITNEVWSEDFYKDLKRQALDTPIYKTKEDLEELLELKRKV